MQSSVDTLIELEENDKALVYPNGYSVRAAYQIGEMIRIGTADVAMHANTFEGALFYRNFDFFKRRTSKGLAAKFQTIADDANGADDLSEKVNLAIKSGDKAEFALDLLFSDDAENLLAPKYIEFGLIWLKKQLERKEADLAPKASAS